MKAFFIIIKHFGVATAIFCMLLTGTAHALFTSYTDEADFLAAVSGLEQQTLDFESYIDGDLIYSGDSAGGIIFDYSIEVDGEEATMMVTYDWYTTSGDNSLGLNTPNESFFWAGDLFSMAFDNSVNALGMYFITDPVEIWAEDIKLITDMGIASNGLEFVEMDDGTRAFFIGLYSSEQFSSASVGFGPDATGVFPFNVDDITIASTTAPVPEPSTLALMGAGLFLGALVHRRRRR